MASIPWRCREPQHQKWYHFPKHRISSSLLTVNKTAYVHNWRQSGLNISQTCRSMIYDDLRTCDHAHHDMSKTKKCRFSRQGHHPFRSRLQGVHGHSPNVASGLWIPTAQAMPSWEVSWRHSRRSTPGKAVARRQGMPKECPWA